LCAGDAVNVTPKNEAPASDGGRLAVANLAIPPYNSAILPRCANMPTSATHQQKPAGQSVTSKIAVAAELRKNTLASEMAVSETIKAGIPVDEVISDKAFMERLVVSGIIPRRTLQYATENNMKRFAPAQSERIVRTMRVTLLAQEAFGDKADEWLDRPTTVFAGETPAEMLVTEAGARAVEMFIG
jgi:putative toxin-antitoxin system antitoxin component (TIGR02293 family)